MIQPFYRITPHQYPLPERMPGSFGFDVVTTRHLVVPRKQERFAPTGWALAEPLPDTVAMLILPRSSLRKRFGCIIPNSPGLVDYTYGEELLVQLENISRTEREIPEGTRIAQLLFIPVVPVTLVESITQAVTLTRSGFGSTGTVTKHAPTL